MDLFDEADATEILSIPLNPSVSHDKLIWHFSKTGIFTVRSTYELACAETIESRYVVSGKWKVLWKLKIPPKVKMYLWRVAHNCIPTKENLMRRRVEVGEECCICRQGYGNLWHSFVSCTSAERCWQKAGLTTVIQRGVERCENFTSLLFYLMELREEEAGAKISMIICASTHSCRGWHDLQVGWVHCGVDATFFVSSKHIGIGMILRDARGNFVAAKVLCLPGCLRVEEGETMGIYATLSWIKQKSLHNVVIESDSKIVVHAIISRSGDVSELGIIVENCRDILHPSPNFKVKHVFRDVNMLAHRIAKSAKDFPNAHVWNEPPEFVEDLLHFPCSC